MIRVAVTGAAGRMGKTNIEALQAAEGVQLGAAIVEADSSLIGADAGEVAGVGKLGISIAGSLSEVLNDFDVLIDFTAPQATLANLAVCAEAGKGMVIG
ncbi:MAG: 4-hydroxy-tetrahydrodipicolinate reductase, partial [Amphritea sp.]|nr:4-hydroxy-tetrahydrodipicolinate reductase [Amphritea sp.]